MADQIRRILAERLQKGVRDPEMGYVTITDVRVSGDVQHATVFYTVLGTDEEREATGRALARATGMLRTEVGRAMTVRLVPSLEFVLDALPGSVDNIEKLIEQAHARDEQLRMSASQAQPAGEASPYRDESSSGSTKGEG